MTWVRASGSAARSCAVHRLASPADRAGRARRRQSAPAAPAAVPFGCRPWRREIDTRRAQASARRRTWSAPARRTPARRLPCLPPRSRSARLRAFGKKGSGTVAGTAQRVLRTTVPDPFFPNALSGYRESSALRSCRGCAKTNAAGCRWPTIPVVTLPIGFSRPERQRR